MKKVPFYANHEDNLHCALAVYRMLFDYFLDRHIGWENMEKMAGFEAHTAAWTVTIWERMSRQGFDIRMIEGRQATLQDIDDMLDDGRLVCMTLNSRALNDTDGFYSHAVLVIDREGEDFIMHDPGLPPRPYRRVTRNKLWGAMGGDRSVSEVTGIKYKPRRMRADVILANMYPTYSRASLAKLFTAGQVSYGDKVLKPGDKLLSNVMLNADLDSLRKPQAGDIDLPVIFEDDDVLVINKPAGVLTHAQGEFNTEASVATFIRHRTAGLTGERAGIVHRLDRATSGVLICAKNPKTLSALQKQFAKREVQKSYIAIVAGHLAQKEAIIDMPIERNPKAPATFRVGPNGKSATTHYKVVEESPTASLVELKPETGRTHQLRVHMAQLGHPIIGDPLYADGKFGGRMYLHALKLELDLPVSHEHKTFMAPLPPEFKEYMAS